MEASRAVHADGYSDQGDTHFCDFIGYEPVHIVSFLCLGTGAGLPLRIVYRPESGLVFSILGVFFMDFLHIIMVGGVLEE